MTDFARLKLRIDSLEAQLADQRVGKLANTGKKAEKATDGLGASFKRIAGPAAVVSGILLSFNKLVTITRQFEVLDAQLITATGSAEGAAQAMEAIQDFAASTPYDLAQVTEGFTKLVNLGLTPSERALTSYGDTASAMGKDLNQMIEAVADAATGEFERLKEFGIRSSKEGDRVKFTFRGVTEEVAFNAAAIEEHLIGLGENNFSGAMAQRMDSLDGALSNLRDEWDKLWVNISQQGIGDLIESTVRGAIGVLEELSAMLASGQMGAYLDAIGTKFMFLAEDATTALDLIQSIFGQAFEWISKQAGASTADITEAFSNMPENIRAFVQIMTVEIAAFVDKTAAYGREIWENLTFWKEESFGLEAELAKIENAKVSTITAILQERETAISSFDAQIMKAKDLRKAYDEAAAARSANQGDRLAGFRQGADPSTAAAETDAQIKAREKLQKSYDNIVDSMHEEIAVMGMTERAGFIYQKEMKLSADATDSMRAQVKSLAGQLYDLNEAAESTQAFEQLRENLRTEEEAIQSSYTKRLEIILNNTEKGSKAQAELKSRLDAEFAEQAVGDLGASPDTFEEQIIQLQDYYERRRQLILDNTALTEEQRTELELELTKQRNERVMALEAERTSAMLQGGASLFEGLAGLSKQFAGEQSGIYKAMFATSKAFAIADAIIKIQQGLANAAALPFPTNLGAIGATVAATGSIVSTISGTNYSGAYDDGGSIPAGKWGIAGEYGPEVVEGPARVRSRKETADAFREGQSGGGEKAAPPQTNIRIINSIDPSVMNDYLGSDSGEEVILNILRNNPEAIRAVSNG